LPAPATLRVALWGLATSFTLNVRQNIFEILLKNSSRIGKNGAGLLHLLFETT
jgi:hypothetical protein